MDLQEFFTKYPRVAIAFSGGVDSTFLLYSAVKYAEKVQAYFIKSVFQPKFELEDAMRAAKELNVGIRVIDVDILAHEEIASNPANRCYYCKKRILTAIALQAEQDGYTTILDGTNASDDAGDRPGVRALEELSVLSPLRLCGLTKAEIREQSRHCGLFTWNKPAYACLATRISSGEWITEEKLRATEAAERYLFGLGLRNVRVRRVGDTAKIQVPAEYIGTIIDNREKILTELKQYYSSILLDLEVRE